MNLTLITPDAARSNQTAVATHVTFRLGRDLYALPVSHVQFMSLMPIHGAATLNSQTVDSVDLRDRLGLPKKETAETDALIVVVTQRNGVPHRTALIVDDVEDVVAGQLEEASPYALRMRPDCVAGTFHIEHKEVTVLDVETLVSPETHKRPSLAA